MKSILKTGKWSYRFWNFYCFLWEMSLQVYIFYKPVTRLVAYSSKTVLKTNYFTLILLYLFEIIITLNYLAVLATLFDLFPMSYRNLWMKYKLHEYIQKCGNDYIFVTTKYEKTDCANCNNFLNGFIVIRLSKFRYHEW